MPDLEAVKVDHSSINPEKEFYLDVPAGRTNFHVKGADNCEWGMKDRLSRIFNPKSGNALMLAFDHGQVAGPQTGLERLDVFIPSIAPYIDVLMCTRGALRTCVPPMFNKAIALRYDGGHSIMSTDQNMTHSERLTDIVDAVRLNVSAMAVQVYLGTPDETLSLCNLGETVNEGIRYGIPTLGVVAVGRQMARTPKFFSATTRIIAEYGAQFVKCYYCEDFEKVVAGCPVPIVIAGGKVLPTEQALNMTYRAISDGAHGVDMGRNVFENEDPQAMAQALRKIIHEGATDKEAYEFYLDIKKR